MQRLRARLVTLFS